MVKCNVTFDWRIWGGENSDELIVVSREIQLPCTPFVGMRLVSHSMPEWEETNGEFSIVIETVEWLMDLDRFDCWGGEHDNSMDPDSVNDPTIFQRGGFTVTYPFRDEHQP